MKCHAQLAPRPTRTLDHALAIAVHYLEAALALDESILRCTECGRTENLLLAYAGTGSYVICQSCNTEMERELS